MITLRILRSAIVLGLGAVFSGCPSESTGPPDSGSLCGLAYLGDKTKPIELEIIARGPDGVAVPVKDGDSVAMILPLQGGRVIFAGVQATNLNPCAPVLTGVLRDLATQQIRLDA